MITRRAELTHPGYRCLGPHITCRRRRLLSMHHYTLTVSLDLWWASIWLEFDWSTYV